MNLLVKIQLSYIRHILLYIIVVELSLYIKEGLFFFFLRGKRPIHYIIKINK